MHEFLHIINLNQVVQFVSFKKKNFSIYYTCLSTSSQLHYIILGSHTLKDLLSVINMKIQSKMTTSYFNETKIIRYMEPSIS